MELTKDQILIIIRELEGNYWKKAYDDDHLEEIINLFKTYLNGGDSKWTTNLLTLKRMS